MNPLPAVRRAPVDLKKLREGNGRKAMSTSGSMPLTVPDLRRSRACAVVQLATRGGAVRAITIR